MSFPDFSEHLVGERLDFIWSHILFDILYNNSLLIYLLITYQVTESLILIHHSVYDLMQIQLLIISFGRIFLFNLFAFLLVKIYLSMTHGNEYHVEQENDPDGIVFFILFLNTLERLDGNPLQDWVELKNLFLTVGVADVSYGQRDASEEKRDPVEDSAIFKKFQVEDDFITCICIGLLFREVERIFQPLEPSIIHYIRRLVHIYQRFTELLQFIIIKKQPFLLLEWIFHLLCQTPRHALFNL